MRRFRRFVPVALVLVVLGLAVACGGDDDDNDNNNGNQVAQEQVTSTTTTTEATTTTRATQPCEPGPPLSVPATLPEPGEPFEHCGITMQVTGTCASNNGDGLSITGSGFTPNGYRQMFAFNVSTGATYFDIADNGLGVGIGPVTGDGTIPDHITWDCNATRSGVPDPEGTYLVGYVDQNSTQNPKPWGYALFEVSY